MSDKGSGSLPWGVEWPTVDGKPVMPGDVLWDSDGTRRRVTEVRFWREGCYVVMDDRSEWGGLVMDREYARTEPPKPVLDRDGVPIEVGDTVYNVAGIGREVAGFDTAGGKTKVLGIHRNTGTTMWCDPEDLTHEAPDSWRRLEEDAGKGACEYFGSEHCECGGCPHDMDPDCNAVMALDIVRRAKALAGVVGDE